MRTRFWPFNKRNESLGKTKRPGLLARLIRAINIGKIQETALRYTSGYHRHSKPSKLPDRASVLECAHTITDILSAAHSECDSKIPWAFVDDAALIALGSEHTATKVELVTLTIDAFGTRTELGKDKRFHVSPGTRHIWYKASNGSSVAVSIVTSPMTYLEKFDANTPVIVVGGLPIIDPGVL